MKKIIEIERKYIIKKPKRDMLLGLPSVEVSSIVQIYISAPRGVTQRIRSRRFESGTRYFETVKKRIDKMSAYEDEVEITEEEFTEKAKLIKKGSAPVVKERISFSYCDKIIEIDIYPKWKKTAVMEIELAFREEEVKIPEFIEVLKEITGNPGYSNAAMAENFPKEDE